MEELCKSLKNICIELHYMGLDEKDIEEQVNKILKELRGEG